MTTSRVDDYPTSMNSHGTEAMKAVRQLLIKYLETQLVPLTFSIPTDTNRWAKSLLTPKKANIKRLLFELNFISMQGGYTELMFEQILNSQKEDDQTDRNT